MSQQAGRYQRSFGGLIGAMLVLVAVVMAFVAFRSVVRNDPPDPVKPVEYFTSAEYARTQVDYPLLAPRELPTGWIATSVTFTPGEEEAWHLGMLTEERRYVGLEQARRTLADMVEQHVDPEAEQGEDVTVEGETWQTWTDDTDTALVREDPVTGVTTLVVTTTGLETLVDFLGILES